MEIGGSALVQEIANLAMETTGPRMRELKVAIEAEDWPQVRSLSHRLRGAWSISALAAKMEDQAVNQALGEVVEMYLQLLQIWPQTQTAIQDWLSEISV